MFCGPWWNHINGSDATAGQRDRGEGSEAPQAKRTGSDDETARDTAEQTPDAPGGCNPGRIPAAPAALPEDDDAHFPSRLAPRDGLRTRAAC